MRCVADPGESRDNPPTVNFPVPELLLGASLVGADLPSLTEMLDRASKYILSYERQASGVVLEESYWQFTGAGNQITSRLLQSDLVIVSVPGERGLLGFRDVFKVDGAAVRDRDARLEKLFLHPTASGLAQAQAVLWESARYNLGPTQRNYNLPTMPLLVLRPENQGRFSFAERGSRTVAGRRARLVAFEELDAPTLIRNPDADRDYFLEGIVSLEEETGAILRTELRLRTRPGNSRLTVEYEWIAPLSLWLPARMTESVEPSQRGSATYRRPRRFGVTTEEKITPPE